MKGADGWIAVRRQSLGDIRGVESVFSPRRIAPQFLDKRGRVPRSKLGFQVAHRVVNCAVAAVMKLDCLQVAIRVNATTVKKTGQQARSDSTPFGVGTMMILVTAFAVLFGVLKTAGVPPGPFAVISLFIGGVAACQSLRLQGKMPRTASFFGGLIMSCLIGAVMTVVDDFGYQEPYNHVMSLISSLFGVIVWAMCCGGPLGYIVGCLVAAIFLVRKEPEDAAPTAEESADYGP